MIIALFCSFSKRRSAVKMTGTKKNEKLTGDELAARINSRLDSQQSLGDRDIGRIRVAAGLKNENCRQALFRTYLVLRAKDKKNRAEEMMLLFLVENNYHKFLENE